jgi:hypothetical protein
MSEAPPIGATVYRLEAPTYGAAVVAEIEASCDPPCLLLTYAEGGQGWWPLDCIAASLPAPADSPT